MVKPLEQEHGDECCPNLNLKGVFSGSDEGFDLQVLLDRLEKYLDLPAILVDFGDVEAAKSR